MKIPTTAAILILSSITALTQQPAATQIPEILKPQFATLNAAYPQVDAKKFPKAPADSVWLCRSFSAASGTVEVAFQGDVVVYMIFRRGTGGSSWKPADILAMHKLYSTDLLREPVNAFGSKYNHYVATQINAAIITRKDFNPKSLVGGV